ncbi:chemotaxis protein CheW [Aphanizomenon flos-aquae NRERC-008]|jgi:positive phototaxis protein PixI|uniref:Purine-binding chemotaxis protein CheW n=1 Tax=Aphanizomenon flos-aquae FACHB-1249 TaxID=2692889 RepID=A0ABR8IQU6_APHFL|nr:MULTISPECIES: chemotaxis protein CheW [Aphanizomenon]MCE2903415.1 chemotaxis protein CheW [Anabaena sp. CoA2_C59]MDJ0504521.1 chemotaxis protein CheW [Nostocales cyanobacterium LE14-WE12]MBD2390509.1 purine-binding chemotaxis protein CheW [Aphanizomenon flos-aquae FACHB-1171]MBD2556014.1 purine-binding chemotaxis protein CheW [Aphanizomenon flos-aquae FACHB-1290]MBD2631454.1 purine-binding chemotaxis protein CheW [Aphanizomenon sp. FACHB-1399]
MKKLHLDFNNQTIYNSGENGYIKFQLNQQTGAVLSIAHTQEVIVVPVTSVTAIPNMPACILGLMNWRSHIIWVVDLPKMFNLECLDHRLHQYNIIVIQIESMILGLVVQEIKGTTKFIVDDVRSPIGQVASSLVPYLCGCVVQQEQILLVLDAVHILRSGILGINE